LATRLRKVIHGVKKPYTDQMLNEHIDSEFLALPIPICSCLRQ
jgi:hypothetical protein